MDVLKKAWKRVCAAIVAVGLLAGGCLPVFAADKTDIRGTFSYAAHDNNHDLTDSFVYQDGFFETSAYETDIHLAVMSMRLASSSISSKDVDDYSLKSRNIQDLLTQIGFQNIEVNQDYQEKMTQNSMGAIAASKDLGDSVLLALIPRSAGYEAEWGGNFNVGSSGLHAGFQNGRDIVLEFAREYVHEHEDIFEGKTVKIWTTGYSRGAAVVNLIGAALDDDAVGYLGLSVSAENIYAYTFGTPLTASTDLNPRAEVYQNIHNYYADYDAVAMLPGSEWNFDRYGKDEALDVHNTETKECMLSFLKELNPAVYESYTSGEDPDAFQSKTLSLSEDGSIQIVADPDTDLSQRDFLLERITSLTASLIQNRETYASEYQQAMTEVTALLLGEDDDVVASFKEGASKSSSIKPLAIMLFLYNWVEDYLEAHELAEAQISTDWRNELIPAPETGGTEEEEDEAESLKKGILSSDEYREIYEIVTSDTLENEYNEGQAFTSYSTILKVYRQIAGKYMKNVLSAGLNNIGYSDHPLIQGTNPEILSVVAAQVLFGTDDALSLDGAMNKINTALNCISHNFMRVHNNEVILSWLRAMEAKAAENENPEDTPGQDDQGKKEPSGTTVPSDTIADTERTDSARNRMAAAKGVHTGDASDGSSWLFFAAGAALFITGIMKTKRKHYGTEK